MPIASVLKGLLHKHDNQRARDNPSSSSPASTSSSQASSRQQPQQAALPSQPEPAHLPADSSRSPPQSSSAAAMNQQPITAGSASGGQHNQQQQQMSQATQAKAEDLVRKDAEAKAKRDQSVFEGLPEGLSLGRKMGDGAFSNVFEATLRPTPAQLAIDPSLGKSVKVAVKCVRKFELNSSQVRRPFPSRSASRSGLPARQTESLRHG